MKYLDAFLAMLRAEKGASPNTIAAYGRDLTDFGFFLKQRGKSALSAHTNTLEQYLALLSDQGFAPRSRARKLSALKEFYRFLFSENLITDNPTDNLESVKKDKPLPNYLSEAEIDELIAVARGLSGKHATHLKATAILELLYATGMRISELCALPLASVLRSRDSLTVLGKGKKERLVPLNPEAISALLTWLTAREKGLKDGRDSKWLFPSSSHSGHITRDGCFKIIKELAVAAGIAPSRVSPHVLRHSFASHLIAHDADLRSVQQMLGHADISTTEIYTHILPDRLSALVGTKHPLAKAFKKR